MSHKDKPEQKVEVDDDRAEMLRKVGWDYVKPGPAPKDDDK